MGFIKAKYCVPFFILVLLTSGFPLNANYDGDSIIEKNHIHDGIDSFDITLDKSEFIELNLSEFGEVNELITFKFQINS